MKIFSAGIETETNTFSPIPTDLAHFDTLRASDVAENPLLLDKEVPFNVWQQLSSEIDAEFYFGLYATAVPSGLTTREAYEVLRDDLLTELQAQLPVDGVLLCLHGAMVAEGYDDCEGDLIQRIRDIAGPNTVIAAELDLHCHLSQWMVDQADIIITLKEYPHIDGEARAIELFELTRQTIEGKCRPVMALFDCCMVGLYPTTSPAMRKFIDLMQATEQQERVLSVSFAHGFPFGDVPESGGKILAITNNDRNLAEKIAERLGRNIFILREQIGFNALSLDQALTAAVDISRETNADKIKPVVVADQSDNPGGGAPADATYALQWLLDNNIREAALAIFYDPEVVKIAKAAGVGAKLMIRLGGKMGATSGSPLDLSVTVTALKESYVHQFPQSQGNPMLLETGDTVALCCNGIKIIVSSLRSQCFSPSIFDDFGVVSSEQKILVVKSSQHFYGAFFPIARQVIYMSGPGALPSRVKEINYQHMSTANKYPWVDYPFTESDKNE